MKDLILRVLISSVIGALVSAGILYFAFDQSMRGLETAVTTTNSRIGDLKLDISGVSEAIAEHSRRAEENHVNVTNKLDNIAVGISDNETNLKSALMATATIRGWQNEVNALVLSNFTHSTELATGIVAASNMSNEKKEEMNKILQRLEQNQIQLLTMTSGNGNELWVNVGPIADLSSEELRRLLTQIQGGN